MKRIRRKTAAAAPIEPRAFDTRSQAKYSSSVLDREYAGLLGVGERKVSWRARFYGLKVRE